MASYTRKLKDSDGNYIIPATRSSCVYMSDDTLLEEYLSSKFNDLEQKIQEASSLSIYPVGSVYQSTGATSPASLFGGSWEQIQNMFLLGSGSRGVGATGGEEYHTLTLSEIPPDHTLLYAYYNRMPAYNTGEPKNVMSTDTPDGSPTSYYGGGQAHNNMPPYYTVNIWRRTA